MFTRRNSCSGLTLVEMLLALTLSVFILSTITSLYITLQKNHLTLNAFNTTQEDARMAFQILRADIKALRFHGCGKVQNGIGISSTSDKLVIKFLNSLGAEVLQMEKSAIAVSNKPKFEAGEVLVISDCQHAETFQVAKSYVSYGKQILIPQMLLVENYNTTAEINRLETHAYYLQNKAFYLENTARHKVALVSGVSEVDFDLETKGIKTTLIFMNGKKWFHYVALDGFLPLKKGD